MRTDVVEIFSDAANAVVMRHPGRRFPGILVQGDTMYERCRIADEVCAAGREVLPSDAYDALNKLRNSLWGELTHYKSVLMDHGLPVPFNERP